MSRYDYVLIDSRTGVSDTSGICTLHLPDIIVVCFTLNYQSLTGAKAVAESARAQRPGIRILPVGKLRSLSRPGQMTVTGYQSYVFRSA